MKWIVLLVFTALSFAACRTSTRMKTDNQTVTPQPDEIKLELPAANSSAVRSPQVFIYKTKGDYYNNVPVLMNNERTQIVSYPAPVDLTIGGKLRLPTRLVEGYLLDNKGIGPNVAFLSYTYEEYSKMATAPTMTELMNHIIAKYPLTTWHYCGPRADYTDLVPQLNALILKDYSQK